MGFNESVTRAKEAALKARIDKANATKERLRKDDATTGDLAAGGLKAPQQASPTQHPRKVPHSEVVKTVDFQGIPVHIDRPRGYTQTGVDPNGKTWKRIYHVDYGFVPQTQGGDQEGVDVFLGLDNEATDAHWVLQKKADGTFDEYKVLLGFPDADMAKGMYLAHVPKRFFGSMATTSVSMMKALLGLHPTETMKALTAFALKVEGELASSAPLLTPESAREHLVRLVLGDGAKKAAADAPATPEQKYVLGIVLEPETVDAQGDVYSADEIRKAAWDYMVNFRNVGLMHKGLVNHRVRLVESYIAPVDMSIGGSTIKAGTWLMGLNVADDALWGQVKQGGLTGLSIGGFATKTPAPTK
jgi:hypothetical protein